jgi:hypothetical protein
LYERYEYRIPKIDPLKYLHYILPKNISKHITTSFNITHSYFLSPITCSTQINTFLSPFLIDVIFGSRGLTFKHKWSCINYAHSPTKELTQQAIHWACLAIKENPNAITILTIFDEDWYANYTSYSTQFKDTHIIICFLPDTIKYVERAIPPKLK